MGEQIPMETSFERQINEHRQMMLTYAKALLGGDSHSAEDVVQEACLVAFRKMDRFDPERSFPKWLRGITRLKVLESHRAKKRSPWATDPAVIEGMEQVYQTFDQNWASEDWITRISALNQCVEKLNPLMQKSIHLVYRKGLSLKQVAEAMSTNVMAAGQRVSRARKLIRECVQRIIQQEK